MTREEAIKILNHIADEVQVELDFGRRTYTNPKRIDALNMAIAALREQDGSFQNGNDHNTVKDWPPYMDLPRDRDVTDINVWNKWISVKRQRPQYKQRVLFVTKAGEVSFAKDSVDWDDGSVSFWDVATDLWVKCTHWMPLPEPPEADT